MGKLPSSLNLNATSPVPLVEITIDQLSANMGANGTTFFNFNHTFTDFVLPGLSTINSGNIPNVALTQGGLATFNELSAISLDMTNTVYDIRLVL